MKAAPSPPNIQSSIQRKNTSNFQHGADKRHTKIPPPLFRYFKTAANKIASVFTIFQRRRQQAAGAVSIAGSSQIRSISFSTDLSTRSDSKASSRYKSSSSYGSSSSTSSTTSFSIAEICKATGNFSPAHRIGEGSFATVYKGRLKDGSLVAIKRAKKNTCDKRLSADFKNEVLTLSKIEHLNLVRFYGYVEHGDERIIVFEYVGNGNLREHLDGKQGNGLEIAERLDIAIDVAHAITYLHTYTDPPIVHRDIKASNILITEKLRAKVTDFGFARLSTEDPGVTHISTQIKGTTGYLDPEYLRTYQLSVKSDVYSFGVLLVELMTGRHPIDQKRPVKERVTIKWAMQNLKEGNAIFVMDPLLRRSPASNMVLERVLKLAHRCLAPLKQSRPSMNECVEVLWAIRKDSREKALSSTHAFTSPQSANYPRREAIKSQGTSGIEDGENRKFISA